LAASLGLAVHDVQVFSGPEGNTVELHVEVNPELNLDQAHDLASRLESTIKSDLPGIESVLTHIEPDGAASPENRKAGEARVGLESFHRAIADFGQVSGTSMNGHQLVTRQTPQGVSLTFHLHLDGNLPIGKAHEISRNLESYLHRRFPELSRIVIHIEPHPSGDGTSSPEDQPSSA